MAPIALAACSQTGDLGRVQRGPVVEALQSRPPAEGQIALTDEERIMRQRTARFVTWDAGERWQREPLLNGDLARPHTLSDTAYADWLFAQGFQSSRARFNRLAADIRTDIAAIPAALTSVCQVLEIDRRRRVAASSLTVAGRDELEAVDLHLRRNAAATAEFAAALNWRYRVYRHALERLILQTPHEESETVDALLTDYSIAIMGTERGEFCAPSRFEG